MAKCFMVVVALAGLLCISAQEGSGACFTDPKSDNCADPSTFYSDQDVNTNLDLLCVMQRMPACTVRNACTAKQMKGDYCKPWSVLSGICSTTHGEMMAQMVGCEKYKQLCIANTKVAGCETQIPKLISTKEVVADTYAACADADQSTLAGCKTCKVMSPTSIGGECAAGPLPTLSAACKVKPTATYCANLKETCSTDATPKVSLCPANLATSSAEPQHYVRSHLISLSVLVAVVMSLFV